jgi:hypothetical protein
MAGYPPGQRPVGAAAPDSRLRGPPVDGPRLPIACARMTLSSTTSTRPRSTPGVLNPPDRCTENLLGQGDVLRLTKTVEAGDVSSESVWLGDQPFAFFPKVAANCLATFVAAAMLAADWSVAAWPLKSPTATARETLKPLEPLRTDTPHRNGAVSVAAATISRSGRWAKHHGCSASGLSSMRGTARD